MPTRPLTSPKQAKHNPWIIQGRPKPQGRPKTNPKQAQSKLRSPTPRLRKKQGPRRPQLSPRPAQDRHASTPSYLSSTRFVCSNVLFLGTILKYKAVKREPRWLLKSFPSPNNLKTIVLLNICFDTVAEFWPRLLFPPFYPLRTSEHLWHPRRHSHLSSSE